MSKNPLTKVQDFGQSIWLDFIRRGILESGELQQLIDEDGLRGMTSNPSIFEKAIAGSHDYDEAIEELALEEQSAEAIYRALTVQDIQRAADRFHPIYDQSAGKHGFVSLEVSPHLAHDTEGTIEEARLLWAAVDRPNLMIKVPGTPEGLPAIRQLLSEGINVNVTLLFGLPRYRQVAEAYLGGLEDRLADNKPIHTLASVASFFLSRIDVLIDPKVDKIIEAGEEEAAIARRLHGQVAIASAKVAYQIYQEIFESQRFKKLVEEGAHPQRLLWASTSTKNPAYSDVKYVEALIGADTVNTLPQETLNAYRDHGKPKARLEDDVDEANAILHDLPRIGIDLNENTQQLEDEGVQKFIQPFDRLMETLEKARQAALQEPVDRQALYLGDYQDAVKRRVADLQGKQFSARLWRKDPSLWKNNPEEKRAIHEALGWLHAAEKMEDNLGGIDRFVSEVKDAGFRHVVHMGMGGSSLAPLVFQRTFKPGKNGLPLTVLDTTDPATILELEHSLPLEQSLFIVASKSGTTAEPLAFNDYFYARLKERKGAHAGENFIVITDPGTPLVDLAKQRGYRRTFLNFSDIGGRFSALSYFGLLPAALLGVDVHELLGRALRVQHACASCVPADDNPGLALGATLGELARHGRDKVTFITPRPIETFGMWLEQLLAESTGKEDKGLLPVAGEPVGEPSVYGADRLFVYFRLHGQVDATLDQRVEALQADGQPVVIIEMDDRLDLGQEFFRWEIATATAGAILGINAFNQPNVQESKDNTNRLLRAFQESGALPAEKASLKEGAITLYAAKPAGNAAPTHVPRSLADFLSQGNQVEAGDYIAIMAYLKERPETQAALQQIRLVLRDNLHLATTLGYGPRFLHSTGQYHNGGPNTGLFLQITASDSQDAPIPGKPYSFSIFKQAEADGDLQALRRHGRRVLRIDLGPDVDQGLAFLASRLAAAEVGIPGD
jgi:transaldolase/glucose-6-phosphate isomerase